MQVTVNGKRVKRPAQSGGAAVRVSLRGRPEGALPDPRDRQDVRAERHDQARPAGADVHAAAEGEAQVRRALLLAGRAARYSAPRRPPRSSTRRSRRRTSPRATSARRSTTRPSTSAAAGPGQRAEPGGGARDRRPPTPSASSTRPPVRERHGRLRRRRAPLRLGGEGLRHRRPGAVHRAQRRDDLRPRLGHAAGPGEAAGHRDHQRLGAGGRAALLVRGADAGEGGLRRADSDPQGQGQSDTRGEAPDENEGSRRRATAGRSSTAPQDALDFFFSTPRARSRRARAATTGTSHAAKQDRRVAAGPERRPTTRSGSCSTRRASASPGTPTAPPASPTSGSATRA